MAYSKTNWVDRSVQYPNRFTQAVNGSLVTLTPSPGTVTQAGTPITASALNKMEQGIYDANRDRSHVEAYQNVGQAVAALTWTKALYQTEVADAKSEYDPSTSRFTAKESGIYQVSATLMSAVSTFDAVVADLLVRKNGVDHVRLWGDTLKINKNTLMAGTTLIKLNAGDYVEIYFNVGGMGGTVNPNTAPGALNSTLRIYQVGF